MGDEQGNMGGRTVGGREDVGLSAGAHAQQVLCGKARWTRHPGSG